MRNNECFQNFCTIIVNQTSLRIERCCYFLNIPENCVEVSFSELPESDEELVSFLLSKATEVPSTFRDLEFGVEKHCNVSCLNAFNLSPTNITINIFGCNLKCVMCHCWEQKQTKEMRQVYTRLLKAFSAYSNLNNLFTTLSGEPFLIKEPIFEILDAGKWVTVISNMTLISEDDINRMKNYKNRLFLTSSVDSISPDIYTSIRKPMKPSDLERVLYTCKKLAEYGVLKGNNITIVEQNHNLDDLIATFEWFKSIGVPCYFGVDNGRNEWISNSDVVKKLNELYPNNWRL